VILVDTGPLVALFDPKDRQHDRCRRALEEIREPIQTMTPVLTEAFHMLGPNNLGSTRLRELVCEGGLSVWCFNRVALVRAFELMELYSDHPMDLADASLVAAAESIATRKVCTVDRNERGRCRTVRIPPSQPSHSFFSSQLERPALLDEGALAQLGEGLV
jgi:predicted nucleic acid-binding protein